MHIDHSSKPDRHGPVPSFGDLAAIRAAASTVDHPLARAVELAILVPGVFPALFGCYVGNIDFAAGRVVVPHGHYGFRPIALGQAAMAVIASAATQCGTSRILVDDHGSPIVLDRWADDYAAELISEADPCCAYIAWNYQNLRHGALAFMAANGVPRRELRIACGLQDPTIRSEWRLDVQTAIADHWSWLLDRETVISHGRRLIEEEQAGEHDFSFRTRLRSIRPV